MESVIFDGREYTKASVLAEKFRYTQDYLGQLCRAKKVDARLVGRAWYVQLDSLLSHRNSRYKPVTTATTATEISPKKAINNYLSRIDVEPILKQKTVKIFKNNSAGVLSTLPVKYEADDHALIPKVYREAISVNLPITPAGAERVFVHKKNKEEINFRPEPLPEVYLSGTLKVAGLPEPHQEIIPQEPKKEPVVVSHKVMEILDQKPLVRPKILTVRPRRPRNIVPVVVTPQTLHHKALFDTMRPVLDPVLDTTPVSVTASVSKTVPAPISFSKSAVEPISKQVQTTAKPAFELPVTPVVEAAVATSPQFKPSMILQKEQNAIPTPRGFSLVVVPALAIIAAFVFGTLIISTNLEILASGSSYDSRFVVQTANLYNFYDRLPW